MQNVLTADSYISPYDELVALETLYSKFGMSLKKVTDKTVISGHLPTEAIRALDGLVPDSETQQLIEEYLIPKLGTFSLAINGTSSWPKKLADSARPTPLIYYHGDLSYIESLNVSVVGARKASSDGLKRAERVARELAMAGVTVTTGLARGIDTAATKAALAADGNVIGVIGTPIDVAYPKENSLLQNEIAQEHLLVSQVPFYRYEKEPFNAHKYRFPERNELMAAVSDATIIVEASDTSGTLTQAKACLHQGRPLFIMRSMMKSASVEWPKQYAGKDGVYILDNTEQVLEVLINQSNKN